MGIAHEVEEIYFPPLSKIRLLREREGLKKGDKNGAIPLFSKYKVFFLIRLVARGQRPSSCETKK